MGENALIFENLFQSKTILKKIKNCHRQNNLLEVCCFSQMVTIYDLE